MIFHTHVLGVWIIIQMTSFFSIFMLIGSTPIPCIFILCSLQTTLGVIAILSGNLAQLVDSYSTGGWLYYGLVFGGLLIMRVTHRKVERKFKVITTYDL